MGQSDALSRLAIYYGGIALRPLRTLRALDSLNSLFSLRALGSGLPLFPFGALNPLWTCVTGITFGALGTSLACGSDGTLLPLGTGNSLFSLWSLRSLRTC